MPINQKPHPARIATRRKRDADATRKAILVSARAAFVQSGFDGAGVREIAAGAGVTAMLVNRYFGSKERLFAEVLSVAMAEPYIPALDLRQAPDIGAEIAARLIEATRAGATPLDGFLILLRSASNRRAGEIGRRLIEKGHQKAMADMLVGDLAAQRAAMVLSIVVGFQLMRQMVGLKALAQASPVTLLRVLAPLMQQLVAEAEPE